MNSVEALENLTILGEKKGPAREEDLRLQDLIPIAMVIAGGCESCAEKMVERALREGSTTQEVDKTLRIVAGTQRLGCFATAVGPEVIARMEKPLSAGFAALKKAVAHKTNDGERQTAKCG